MKKSFIVIGLLGLGTTFGIFGRQRVSADTSTPTSIIDQIENPYKGTESNHNGPRNWQMSGSEYLMEATHNGEITYRIKSTDPYYQKIWTDAANAWNKLGVIKFVPVTSGEQITLLGDESSPSKVDWYGNTYNDIYDDPNDPTRGYFIHNKAELCGKLDKNPSHYILNVSVAEHELGHTLGLGHDDSRGPSGKFRIMHDGTSYKFAKYLVQPLGKYEKQTLLKFYKPGQTQVPEGYEAFANN